MPWKISTERGEVCSLNVGEEEVVSVPNPLVPLDEKLMFQAKKTEGFEGLAPLPETEYLLCSAMENGRIVPGSGQAIYPSSNKLADSLAMRGIKVKYKKP